MKQKLKPETWVGIFLIAGILMIIGVILGFGNIKTSKEQTYPINIIFKDAAGLIKDSQLRLGGVTVGKVTKAPELLPSGNEVMLEASILSDVKIQEGSVFRVDMQNILGDKYIDIVPPARPTHEYIPPHATIIGQPESDFSKIKNNAVGATEEILKILKQIEKNSDNIDEAILNIGEAAKGLAQTTKLINESILSDVKIQEGSVFRVDMQNILGDKYIDIVPPARPTHEYIPPHATIIGQPESDFSKIKNNAVGATEEILKILKQIEKNSDNIDEAILNIGEAAKGLAQTTKLINESILSRENLRHLNSVLAQMNKAGEQLPATMAAMKDTVSDARRIIAGAEEKLNSLDPAIKEIPPTLTALRKASEQIASVTADARKNQGFLGLLMYDARFRANAQEFIRNLRDYGILRYRNPNEPQAKPDPRGGFSGSRR